MKTPNKVLIVEDDKGMNKKIVDGLGYLLAEEGFDIEVLSAYTYEEGLILAKELDIKSFVIDINLPNDRNGVDLVEELRELGYTYNGVVFVTKESGDSYKVQVHERTKYARFLSKPIDMNELAGEVFLQTMAPDLPKKKYLPLITQNNVSFRLNRETTICIQKVKHKDKIEVWQKGESSTKAIRKEYPIESFEKLVEILLLENEKQFRKCERTSIVNTDLIEEINKAKHYMMLTGHSEKVSIGPTFRDEIYTLY